MSNFTHNFSNDEVILIKNNTLPYYNDEMAKYVKSQISKRIPDIFSIWFEPLKPWEEMKICKFCYSRYNLHFSPNKDFYESKFTSEELKRIKGNTKSYIHCECGKNKDKIRLMI